MRIVIIGAGVVGLSIARVLSMYKGLDIVVVEKEPDVGWGASKANTSIIHPGHEEDPELHPLRARLCVEGNKLWRQWVKELDIPAKWPGELMVFTNSEEEKEALRYIDTARRNNVPGVRAVYGDELRRLEPAISPMAVGAVYAPTAGNISPFEAVAALAENLVENGGRILVNTLVKSVRIKDKAVEGVETSGGFIQADIVINAAGVHADEISHSAGVEEDFVIRPRKGEYIVFDEDTSVKPLRLLHTTPTSLTKGVYAITTTGGDLLIGPTAVDMPYELKEDTSTTLEGIEYLLREAGKLLRELPPRSLITRTFAGVRPEPPHGEWLIKVYEEPWGFINVAGIRSPGLTAAPAIAYYVADMISKSYAVSLEHRSDWKPYRRGFLRLHGKSLREIDELVSVNPDYGEVICYCRTVSKAEILEAVKRIKTIGAQVTLDGVKFRTKAGFGRCQGSFCRWRIAGIIAGLEGKEMHEVVVKMERYGLGDVKKMLREEA
ncbi:Glycerol-3-phosphate dehydrogenase [Desulfurococcus amylolyticus 1221n]|uniref:Glycerol-3-phosphate dehydrogenase n=1 Tax=Desulfurococcus amylolyticus (strain DSM 18924 / JCM 16383 / VKM B-2413 / 1221n) TaxID=490899 RepID=B8D526_DESA1|nr:NAD(P)/FAD-dependent oxidoreductase [Desulfurococcus amylolyticus]ACL11207.1 Glycerol-3-phosphate dehydrogenase [Desulfurococcus amylolyticus 1221n]